MFLVNGVKEVVFGVVVVVVAADETAVSCGLVDLTAAVDEADSFFFMATE